MEMFAIIVLLGAVLFVGMVLFARWNTGMKPAPVPVESMPAIGDVIRYADKRTGLDRGRATVVGHRHGLVTLCHGENARSFSVRPSRIQN